MLSLNESDRQESNASWSRHVAGDVAQNYEPLREAALCRNLYDAQHAEVQMPRLPLLSRFNIWVRLNGIHLRHRAKTVAASMVRR